MHHQCMLPSYDQHPRIYRQYIKNNISHTHAHRALLPPQFALLVRPWISSSSTLVTGLVQWDQCDRAEKYIKSSLEQDSWCNTGVPLLRLPPTLQYIPSPTTFHETFTLHVETMPRRVGRTWKITVKTNVIFDEKCLPQNTEKHLIDLCSCCLLIWIINEQIFIA